MILLVSSKNKTGIHQSKFQLLISSISVAEKTNPTEITIADLMPAEQSY
jgi:tRNA A37 threonylcarbamoyladenosine dehydratase